MATSQSKFGRRFDEEFKREVARDLGVSPWSVSRWKRQYGGGESTSSVAAPASFLGVSMSELERRLKALERENAYGGASRWLEVASNTAVWYHSGLPPVALRRVIIRQVRAVGIALNGCGLIRRKNRQRLHAPPGHAK